MPQPQSIHSMSKPVVHKDLANVEDTRRERHLSNGIERKKESGTKNLSNEWIKGPMHSAVGTKQVVVLSLSVFLTLSQCLRLATQSGDSKRKVLASPSSESLEWRVHGSSPQSGFPAECHHFMTLIWIVCKINTIKSSIKSNHKKSANLACSVMLHFPWIPLQAMRPLLVRRRNSKHGSTLVALDTASGITQWQTRLSSIMVLLQWQTKPSSIMVILQWQTKLSSTNHYGQTAEMLHEWWDEVANPPPATRHVSVCWGGASGTRMHGGHSPFQLFQLVNGVASLLEPLHARSSSMTQGNQVKVIEWLNDFYVYITNIWA